MTRTRPLLTLVLAGCSWAHLSLAQSGDAGAAGAASGTGTGAATSGSTTPTTPAATDGTKDTGTTTGTKPTDGTTPAKPPTGTTTITPTTGTSGTTGTPVTPSSNPFGFGGPDDGLPVQTSLLKPGNNGATTTFGLGKQKTGTTSIVADKPAGTPTDSTEETKPTANPTTFTAPGFFGAGQQQFTAGQGRFTRPRYRYTVSSSMGFDDNTLQTPDGGGAVPAQEQRFTIPAVPEISETRNVFVVDRVVFNQNQTPMNIYRIERQKVILRPAQDEQVIVQRTPGIPGQARSASVVTSLNGSVDVQWVRSRSALTFDLNAGVEYYWNRPGNAADYNGGLSFAYVRRVNSRMQFSTTDSLTYQAQPDYTRVNLQNQGIGTGQGNGQGSGSYFALNTKNDLTYRWGQRFSTDTSVSVNTIFYADSQRKSSNFWEAVLGNEFKYLYSSRVSLIGELRYGITRYLESDTRDSNTVYLLVGTDYRISRRASLTFRLGESSRSFAQGGARSSTPYGEGSLNYQYSSRTTFGVNGRYGFEESSNPGDQNTVGRIGISYSHAFTPRLSSALSMNFIHNSSQSATTNANSNSEVYDVNASLGYRFNRHFMLSTRYSYTLNATSLGNNDYDRSRFFITGQYEF